MAELVGEEDTELGEEPVLILFLIRPLTEIKPIHFLLLICELYEPEWEKRFLQFGHSYGFSPAIKRIYINLLRDTLFSLCIY